MIFLFIFGSFLLSALLGLIVIPNILFISYKKRLFDEPDARKVHTCPVPRLGGVSFLPVILITTCLSVGLLYSLQTWSDKPMPMPDVACSFLFLACGCIMLYLVGVADDLIGVGYRYKFVVQLLASLLLTSMGGYFHTRGGLFGLYYIPWWAGIPFTMLIIVYITNAINLIDGIDGLASGLSCIALAVLGTMAIVHRQYIHAILALATLGILVPFWFYNVFGNARRGHKLFMGDAGSLTLGFILSFLVIHLGTLEPSGSGKPRSQMILAFSTLIVPLFDVVRVVLHRLREGKNPFLPDKNHFHHKLLRTGMRVRGVLITILSVALFFIVLNLLLAPIADITWLFVLNIVLWTLMQLGINWAIKRAEKK